MDKGKEVDVDQIAYCLFSLSSTTAIRVGFHLICIRGSRCTKYVIAFKLDRSISSSDVLCALCPLQKEAHLLFPFHFCLSTSIWQSSLSKHAKSESKIQRETEAKSQEASLTSILNPTFHSFNRNRLSFILVSISTFNFDIRSTSDPSLQR